MAYLPFVSSPVARKRYTSPTTAIVRPLSGLQKTGMLVISRGLTQLFGERILGREFREIVVANDVHFVPMAVHQTTKVIETCPTHCIVIGTLGGNGRDGMIVRRQFGSQVIRIANVQEPPISLLDRHPAVTEGVTEQWDQQHFG